MRLTRTSSRPLRVTSPQMRSHHDDQPVVPVPAGAAAGATVVVPVRVVLAACGPVLAGAARGPTSLSRGH